ncbi:MAG: hypothetical protein ACRDYV_00070, partial [Acidimicrobiia bacterium]
AEVFGPLTEDNLQVAADWCHRDSGHVTAIVLRRSGSLLISWLGDARRTAWPGDYLVRAGLSVTVCPPESFAETYMSTSDYADMVADSALRTEP